VYELYRYRDIEMHVSEIFIQETVNQAKSRGELQMVVSTPSRNHLFYRC